MVDDDAGVGVPAGGLLPDVGAPPPHWVADIGGGDLGAGRPAAAAGAAGPGGGGGGGKAPHRGGGHDHGGGHGHGGGGHGHDHGGGGHGHDHGGGGHGHDHGNGGHVHDHGHGGHDHGHDHGHGHGHGHGDGGDAHDHGAGAADGDGGGCCSSHPASGWRAYLPHSHSLSNRLSHDEATLRQVALVLLVSISAQATGALAAHSGLLAVEAAHGLLDGLNVLLALLAVSIVARYPATAGAPYGHGRVEVLSAAVGIALLGGMVVKLSTSATVRLVRLARHGSAGVVPAEGRLVMAAEAVTLAANGVMAWLLGRRRRPTAGAEGAPAAEVSLNMRALRAHVIADCVENGCVLAAGAVMWAASRRGWVVLLDPLATLAVAAVVAGMNVGLVWEVVGTLMQWAPPGVDVGGVGADLRGLDGVVRVSGLRVWTLTSGSIVATVRLWTGGGTGKAWTAGDDADTELLAAAERVLRGVGATETCVQIDHRPPPPPVDAAAGGDRDGDVELGVRGSPYTTAANGGEGSRAEYTPFMLASP